MNASLEKDKGKKRLSWLDFGKAAGILVVLLVHAECSLGPLTFYGGMFYMPVFFVAAGYTFRFQKEECYGDWLKKKAKRLLVPYFGVSAFLWLVFWVKDSLLAGNPGDLKWWSILGIFYSRNQMYANASKPLVLLDMLNAPLWFLTAMFLTYAWYGLISRSKRKYVFLLLGAAGSIVWHYSGGGTFFFLGGIGSMIGYYSQGCLLPWSLEAVPYFACYFAAGEWFRQQKKEKMLGELWCLGMLTVVFLISAMLNGSMNLSNGNYGHSMLLGLAAGISGSFLVFGAGMFLERKAPAVMGVVSLVGQNTLTILCFHMFLFMFIKTGASVLGLSAAVTKALLVLLSLVILTAAGCMVPKIFSQFRSRIFPFSSKNRSV